MILKRIKDRRLCRVVDRNAQSDTSQLEFLRGRGRKGRRWIGNEIVEREFRPVGT